MPVDLTHTDVLIAGQLMTSRTEALEDYLRLRARSLGVIGLMSPFAVANVARCSYYVGAGKVKERRLLNFSIRNVRWWNKWLIAVSAFVYVISFGISLVLLKKRFDLFIGIATFSAFAGVVFKKCGLVKKAIYYCLDFYPPPQNVIDTPFYSIFKIMDAFIMRGADLVWDLSPMIEEGRTQHAGIQFRPYQKVVVPLGYPDAVYADVPFQDRERWSLGFVGTLSENQGLQLVAQAMPVLARCFPKICLHIIGHGPFAGELKQIIQRLGVGEHFVFHGFVQSDERVHQILSRCIAGIAVWTGAPHDNSRYADPGKPKLYALLGLPVIITDGPYVAKIIAQTGAGIAIAYRAEDFVRAVTQIVADRESFERYHSNVKKFTPYCKSVSIFDEAFTYAGKII